MKKKLKSSSPLRAATGSPPPNKQPEDDGLLMIAWMHGAESNRRQCRDLARECDRLRDALRAIIGCGLNCKDALDEAEQMERIAKEALSPENVKSPVIYGASLVIPTNPSWANSPIHQEVQEWEKESIRAQDVNKPSETLVAERDRLDDQLDQIILRLGETQERMIDAERQRDRLAAALNRACANPTTGNWYREAQDAITAWKEARSES